MIADCVAAGIPEMECTAELAEMQTADSVGCRGGVSRGPRRQTRKRCGGSREEGGVEAVQLAVGAALEPSLWRG